MLISRALREIFVKLLILLFRKIIIIIIKLRNFLAERGLLQAEVTRKHINPKVSDQARITKRTTSNNIGHIKIKVKYGSH